MKIITISPNKILVQRNKYGGIKVMVIRDDRNLVYRCLDCCFSGSLICCGREFCYYVQYKYLRDRPANTIRFKKLYENKVETC